MTYRIEFKLGGRRSLTKLDSFIRRKVIVDIEKLAESPRPFGVEKLKGADRLYRVYVGPGNDYLVIYEIQDIILLIPVVKVGDRKDVYRSL